MHYCDHALSIVRPSSLTFHIVDFSSETAERNSTKHDRKQDLIVLYQVRVFSGLIRKTRWPTWPIRQKGGTLYSGARYMALWAPYYILDLFIMFHIVHFIVCKPSARPISLTMKYNMFKGTGHYGLYIDTYISLHSCYLCFFFVQTRTRIKGSYSPSFVSPYTFRIFYFF